MSSKPLVSNGITSFWRTEPDALDNYRSTDYLPEESDIVVIGAGYAGASTVHHLLDQSDSSSTTKTPSITILEARQACSGATGRNGGHMKPDAYNGISNLAAEYGVQAAAEVAAFEAKHVHYLKSFVDREEIDCDYVVTKAIDVQLNESYCKTIKERYTRLVASGCEPAREVQYIDKDEAEAFSGVKAAAGCFTYPAGHIWPYKFVLHLLTKAVARGVNLQTHTPVSRISKSATTRDRDRGRWIVHTPRGNIIAKTVVLATNAYTSALAPQYQDRIVPVRGTCSRIVVPRRLSPSSDAASASAGANDDDEDNIPRLSNTYTLRWNSWDYDYLIPRHDGSIVVGGARSAYIHDLKNWYNVTDDSRVLQSAARYFDNYMQRNFVGWEDSGAYTDRVWTGIMGYSSDGLPHIGQIPNIPGQFILAGFTGHGMPQIFLSAKALAQMILTGAEFEDTELPSLFKTSQARLSRHENKILKSYPAADTIDARL